MDIPLGHNIGNSLEVIEAVETLKGNGPKDLTEVCMHLASNMLYLAGQGTLEVCREMVKEVIENGRALEHLAAMVRAQGGDDAVIWIPINLQRLHILTKSAQKNPDTLPLWIPRVVELHLRCWVLEEKQKTVRLIFLLVSLFTKK